MHIRRSQDRVGWDGVRETVDGGVLADEIMCLFWEIRLFFNTSVFWEFSGEINVLPSNPRLPPV